MVIHNSYTYAPKSPHFTAMKKSQFSGVSLFAVNTFKAPIEKFNAMDDFTKWAETCLKDKFDIPSYYSKDHAANFERMRRLNQWKKYLMDINPMYTAIPALALIIMHSITKKLTPDNREQPPIINAGALAQTVEEMNIELEKSQQFNFITHYVENLRNVELAIDKTHSIQDGWVKIPSKENDFANFATNVQKLKTLSHPSWCTSSSMAQPYLSEGDFHIYIEGGKPKLGVRFKKDKITEIEGELNNKKIPAKYFRIIEEHIKTNALNMDNSAQKQMEEAEVITKKIEKFRKKHKDALESTDVAKLYKILKIKYEELPDGTYRLEEYKPKLEIPLDDLGINEHTLFAKVSEITKDCYLDSSGLETFKTLKKIGGSLTMYNCKMNSLGSLEHIGKNFWINHESKLKSLGNLKYIGKNADIAGGNIISMGKVEEVGGNLNLQFSGVKTLSALKEIGGNLDNCDNLASLGELRVVRGNCNVKHSDIVSLGKLRYVGKTLDLKDLYIQQRPQLEFVRKLIDEDGNEVYWKNYMNSIHDGFYGDTLTIDDFENGYY